MKSRLLALALLALGAGGCVDDRSYLELYGVCAIGDECTFSGTCDAFHMGPVYYDPTEVVGKWLVVYVEVHNQLPNNEDLASGRVNTNDANITGGNVEFTVDGTTVLEQGFNTSGTVPANGTAVIKAFLAPTTIVNGEYIASLTFRGSFVNGNDFEAGPLPVGLSVANFSSFCATSAVCPPEAGAGQRPVGCAP